MKVYHLSHTDLDGYGCQLVSREFFREFFKEKVEIRFYNANYGREVGVRLNMILDDIAKHVQGGEFDVGDRLFGSRIVINVKGNKAVTTKNHKIDSNKRGDFKGLESGLKKMLEGMGGAKDSKDSKDSRPYQNLDSKSSSALHIQPYFVESIASCQNIDSETTPVSSALKSIPPESNALESITPKSMEERSEKFTILITDLNLSANESRFLDEQVKSFRASGLDIELILLDHHASGQESADTYKWYFLDISRCATKITYEYLPVRFGIDDKKQERLKPIVEMINSVDIWLENGFGFEFGKVAMSLIATSNEINRHMFDVESREYKLELLSRSYDFLREYESKAGGLIDGMAFDEVAFDNAIFFLKKHSLGGNKDTETMDNIISRVQVQLLEKRKEQCKVYYADKVGFLSYGMGGISVVANRFLSNNADEFDFYIDVGNRGSVSLRSNGSCDVSALSQSCFNGGGHKNASGGRMENFKESFLYEDIKAQVQERLESQNGQNNKESWEL